VKINSTSQLERALGAGPLLPVYLVSAEEPLSGGEAADAVRAAARRQGFEEREVYAVERTAPWAEILASAQSMSLFSTRKVIELRMPGGKPGHGAKQLVEVIGAAGPDVLLMILTEKLDYTTQKSEWVAAAQAAGAWVDLPAVDAARFPAWIRARAQREGLELDDDGVAVLAARTEGNLLAAHQEIQKLVLGGNARAGVAEVLASVAASSRFDVFQLGESLLAGEAPRALRILASLRSEGTEPTLVLWAILQEMRNLWLKLVPGAPIPGVWSSNTAQLPQAISRVRAAPSPRALFMRLGERASRADRMIKGRLAGNPWDELTQLALEFAGLRVLPLTKT
jgi:DNA polymerase III subunit delta